MSLTSLLRERDVRERFDAEFEKPRLDLCGAILATPTNPSTAHAALIGTAFDYVLRLQASILNEAVVRARAWTAEAAVEKLAKFIAAGFPIFPPGATRSQRGVLAKAQQIVRDARSEYGRCQKRRRVSREMLRYAVMLAQLEQFYRCGFLSASFGQVKDAQIADLNNLVAVARRTKESFGATRICILNPDFKDASMFVGGADADLLIDDTLIEIKTTKELKFTAEAFRQLVGYYALSRIGGVTSGSRMKPKIRSLGIYFSRYGVFCSFPVKSVINANRLLGFLRWFKQRALRGQRSQRMFTVDGVSFES